MDADEEKEMHQQHMEKYGLDNEQLSGQWSMV